MLRQISLFAENKKGTMHHITSTLAERGININALVTNDSAEFGIVRMLVSDPNAACACFAKAGYLVHSDPVIAVEIGDTPGSLDRLLQVITESNINVDYLYMSYDRDLAMPIAVIRTGEEFEVAECLKGKGYTLL